MGNRGQGQRCPQTRNKAHQQHTSNTHARARTGRGNPRSKRVASNHKHLCCKTLRTPHLEALHGPVKEDLHPALEDAPQEGGQALPLQVLGACEELLTSSICLRHGLSPCTDRPLLEGPAGVALSGRLAFTC